MNLTFDKATADILICIRMVLDSQQCPDDPVPEVSSPASEEVARDEVKKVCETGR